MNFEHFTEPVELSWALWSRLYFLSVLETKHFS